MKGYLACLCTDRALVVVDRVHGFFSRFSGLSHTHSLEQDCVEGEGRELVG